MAARQSCIHGPCAVPPHPDAQDRLDALRQLAADDPAAAAANALASDIPTGVIQGLNDGQIFPRDHFDEHVAEPAITNAALERAPLRGAIRIVIVLVDFSDHAMAVGTADRMRQLFFSTGQIATGSVTEYYTDASGGNVSFAGDVFGPYRMPHTAAYYANNGSGLGARPNMQDMAADALSACRNDIDFSHLDNDGNGYVDGFVIVHAGPAGEVTLNKDDIWSAKWTLPSEVSVNNGKKVFAFLTIPQDAQIGVSCHELGHLIFGWPDFYDTDKSSVGIGRWCVMGSGSWLGSPAGTRPCHPSAWCKAKQGWVNVTAENHNRQITLGDVKWSRDVRRLWTNGDTGSKEYFLIENRQLAGFDQFLPGPGLLIWHVDDNVSTNTDENHRWLDLMQADGLNQLKLANAGRGDAGDPFPGSANNQSFSALSNPNSKAYSGVDTFVTVTNISPSAPTMRMDVTVEKASGWNHFELASFNNMARKSDIAAVSRIFSAMEVWWIGADGSVQGAFWYADSTWKRYQLAPAGSAALGGSGITVVSRIPTAMEVWWIGPAGSVEGAFWYEGNPWKRYQLAPNGSAAIGSKIAAVSRIKTAMEVWWIGPNGSVQDAYWYEGPGWKRFELAPGGSAAIGGITALARNNEAMEVWWIGIDGSVQDAYWYPTPGWKRFTLAPTGSAAAGTSLASVARITDAMEVWWIGPNGSVQDSYWYPQQGWKHFELAPAGSATAGGIGAVARVKEAMEVWWTGPDGSVQDAFWYPSSGWRRFQLVPPGSAAPGGEFAVTARVPGSMEIWYEGPNGTLQDGFWYEPR